KRDDVDVTRFVGKETPVDPGNYTFEASAPDRESFTVEVKMTEEGKTVDVEVPELKAHGAIEDTGAYPIDLPSRPILIPKAIIETPGVPDIQTSDNWTRAEIDAGLFARGRLGPVEIDGSLGFILRWHETINKPNQWNTIGLGVRYPINPGFVVGIGY